MTDAIQLNQSEHVLTIRFNRPDKRNAITQAMYTAMAEALNDAAQDDNCRVVIFAGSESCFTAGNDLKDFMTGLGGNMAEAPVLKFLRTAAAFPKPMLAAVNGHAVGIGTTLLMHCDLICAGEGSRFQLPFVNLGLVPEFASSLLLPRITGYPKAAEWLLLGDVFGPEAAEKGGLINRVTAPDQVELTVQAWADTLAAKPPQALQASRKLMRETTEGDTMEAIEREARVFQQRLQSREFAEQVSQFFQR